MKSHINISGVPDNWNTRQYLFPEKFQQPVSNPYYNKANANQQKKPGPLIYDWQIVDDKPERSGKEEKGNLYVSDWQMDSQN